MRVGPRPSFMFPIPPINFALHLQLTTVRKSEPGSHSGHPFPLPTTAHVSYLVAGRV